MVKTLESNAIGTALRIGIVAGRFNERVTEGLLAGALRTLTAHGVDEADITVAWVPGAFELPLFAKKLAQSGEYDAVIALGCVIRGATAHYDHVCAQAASGLLQAGLETGIPVLFGVLTTETLEQALERSGAKAGNKGADVALAAIETANLARRIQPLSYPTL